MKKYLRFIILVSLTLFVCADSQAQFKSAVVGIDGLTCSACSFATEKSIRKLDFVDSVQMELDKNIALVYFKKGATVSMKALAQKIFDAGFSVRNIDAIFNFNELKITTDYCFEYESNMYHFLKIDREKTLNEAIVVRFVGEKFMSRNEFKTWKLFCVNKCKLSSPLSTEYFVTLH